MENLIQQNKEFYKHLMVVDNCTPRNDGKISINMRTAFLRVDSDKNHNRMLFKSCMRHGFKVDGVWGYECFHLDTEKGILWRYAMEIRTNRPYPSYFSNHLPVVIKKGSHAVDYYDSLKDREYYEFATYCNLNTAIHVLPYANKCLANEFVCGIPELRRKLAAGVVFNDNFLFHPVTYQQAVDFSKSGGLAIAIVDGRDKHVAPLYGEDIFVNKRDQVSSDKNENCGWLLNVGADDKYGYQSIFRGFYIDRGKIDTLDFYILLNLFTDGK